MTGLHLSLVAAFYEPCDFELDIHPLWGSAFCKMELTSSSLSFPPALSFFFLLPSLLFSLYPLSSFPFLPFPTPISASPTHTPHGNVHEDSVMGSAGQRAQSSPGSERPLSAHPLPCVLPCLYPCGRIRNLSVILVGADTELLKPWNFPRDRSIFVIYGPLGLNLSLCQQVEMTQDGGRSPERPTLIKGLAL